LSCAVVDWWSAYWKRHGCMNEEIKYRSEIDTVYSLFTWIIEIIIIKFWLNVTQS
jgi:hypothetical protein